MLEREQATRRMLERRQATRVVLERGKQPMWC